MIDQKRIKFCDATHEDLNAIVEIYNSTIPGRMVTADLDPVTVESRMEWFSNHSPDFRPIWVMKYDGKVCGWLSFQSFYGRPAYNGTSEMSIYIAEEYRGNGLGKIFLQKAIEACGRLEIKVLLGFVFGHNGPSLGLFHAFGFEDWGILPKIAQLDGVERDLVIVGKRVQ